MRHIRGKPSEENEILLPSSVFFKNIFAQIGVILRDSHGVAQVRYITGNKILRILKAKGNFYRVSWILFSFSLFWWWNYENWFCNTLFFYQGLREAFLKIFTSWSKKQLLFVNILKSIGRCVLLLILILTHSPPNCPCRSTAIPIKACSTRPQRLKCTTCKQRFGLIARQWPENCSTSFKTCFFGKVLRGKWVNGLRWESF